MIFKTYFDTVLVYGDYQIFQAYFLSTLDRKIKIMKKIF